MSTNMKEDKMADLAMKVLKWTRRADTKEPINNLSEPFCILDIRYEPAVNNFEFIVSMSESNVMRNADIDIRGIEDLTLEYRIWLLAKFKRNLKSLAFIEKMGTWVLERLTLLKDYCEFNELAYESLYVRSSLPPNNKRIENQEHTKMQHADEQMDYNCDKNLIEQPEPQRKCLSVRQNKSDVIRLVPSKLARLRAIYNSVKLIIAKYRNRKSISKQAFVGDLESMNAYIYDL